MSKKGFLGSMSNKIMAQIILLIVVICSTTSIISFIKTKNNMIKTTYENLENRTKDSAIAINSELSKNMKNLEYIASLPEVQSMDYSKWKDIVYQQSLIWGFEAVYIFDNNGMAYYTDDTVKDQSQDSYFAEIQEKKQFITDTPWIDVENKRSIATLITPIKNQNEEILGYMCGTLNLEYVNEIVQNIKIGENGYAFLVNKDGIIAAHKNMDLVYNATNILDLASNDSDKNDVEKLLLDTQTKKANISDMILNDEEVYISYDNPENTDWSLVLVSPSKEILESINQIAITQIVLTCMGIILSIFISLFIRRQISRELKRITNYSEELSKCNLAYKDESKINNVEFREVVGSLNSSVDALNETISEVKSSSNQIASSSEEIDDMIVSISLELEQSASAVEEISASMEECSASINEVNSMVQKVDNNTKVSVDISADVLELSKKIESQSNSLHEEAISSKKDIELVFDKCKKELEEALGKVTVVKNISTMSESIMSISEQTNLLSLNASIEAARAGEHGKGFAVVANEVKKLAEQSTATVSDIQKKVNEALDAVNDLSLTSKELLGIVEKDIMDNYNKIINVTTDYQETGKSVKKISEDFSTLSEEIHGVVSSMTNNIEGLSESIGHVSSSTNVIAENMVNINSKNETIVNKAHNNKKQSTNLLQLVDKFKL